MTLKDYIKTFVPVSIMLFLALQKGTGLVLLFLFMFVLAMIVNVIRIILKRGERKKFTIRLGIWTTVLLLSGGVQDHWSAASRNEAESAAKAVLAYKARSGSYPAGLKEAGIDGEQLYAKWGIRYFMRTEGKPVVTYPSSMMPLTQYDYDFATQKWVVNSY